MQPQILINGEKFTLTKIKNKRTGRVHYVVSTKWVKWQSSFQNMDNVRKHFDPNLSISGRYGSSWKFSNRDTAEKLLVMAILKWGA